MPNKSFGDDYLSHTSSNAFSICYYDAPLPLYILNYNTIFLIVNNVFIAFFLIFVIIIAWGVFMNSQIKNLFLSKNLEIKGNVASGIIDGINVRFVYADTKTGSKFRFMFIGYLDVDKKAGLIDELERELINFSYSYNQFCILCDLENLSVEQASIVIPNMVDKTISKLKNNNYLSEGYCPFYGSVLKDEDSVILSKKYYNIKVSKECKKYLDGEKNEAKRAYSERKKHYLKGFLGALIGGVVGAIIHVIFYKMGFLSALSGGVAFILGSFLFVKFGGKPDYIMILIVTLTSIVFIMGTFYVEYLYEAHKIFNSPELNINWFDAFDLCYKLIPSFKDNFWKDFGLNLLFLGLGLIIPIIQAVNYNRKYR